jgi:multidrug resistance efflux pump
MEKTNKIELLRDRSDEVQEILGRSPAWPVMWGNVIIFCSFILFLILSWTIQYPDQIRAKIVLTTAIPPHHVVAKTSGKILQLAVENEKVKKNDVVCVLENPANQKDVFTLSEQLHTLSNDQTRLLATSFNEHLSLGEFQQEYNNFLVVLDRARFFQQYDPVEKEISAIQSQLLKKQSLLKGQAKQRDIYEKQQALMQTDYDRDKKLFEKNVISAKALEEKEYLYLNASANFESAELNLTTTQIQISELEKELQGKRIQNEQQKNDLKLAVQESLQKLKSAVAGWEVRYVLRSPIDGYVSFFDFWSTNQFVKSGDEIMVIVPEQQQEIIGKLKMPVQNSGKAKVGQLVNIQLDNYPYQEYGMIKGKVKNISLVPSENAYAIDVSLPDNLRTTYKNKIEFKQELQGDAEIITEDLRLLERMFFQLRKIFVT